MHILNKQTHFTQLFTDTYTPLTHPFHHTSHATSPRLLTLVTGGEGPTPLPCGLAGQERAAIQGVAKGTGEGHIGAKRGVSDGRGL